MVHSYALCVVGVMFLRGKTKKWSEVRIPKKGFDAVDHIAVKNFAHFGTNHHLMSLKTRTTTAQILIDESVQFPCIFERQPELFLDLKRLGESPFQCVLVKKYLTHPIYTDQFAECCRAWSS